MSSGLLVSRLRELLVGAGRDCHPLHYGEYARRLGLAPDYRPHLQLIIRALKEIMREDHRRGRPYASVAAVRLDDNLPGWGFAELAWELGRFSRAVSYQDFVAAEWERFRTSCRTGPALQAA